MKKPQERIMFTNYCSTERENDCREFLFSEYGNEKGWETKNSIPDSEIYDELNFQEEIEWDDFKNEFSHFIDNSKTGFLLQGNVGTWQGAKKGGFTVTKFDDLYKCWDGCDYIEIFDKKGHLYIKCSHHDGTNFYELKEMTAKGADYENNADYWKKSTEEIHNTIMNCNLYSKLPRYAEKVWGC